MMILLLFGFGCHIFPAYVLKFQKVSFLLTLIIGFIFRRQLDSKLGASHYDFTETNQSNLKEKYDFYIT